MPQGDSSAPPDVAPLPVAVTRITRAGAQYDPLMPSTILAQSPKCCRALSVPETTIDTVHVGLKLAKQECVAAFDCRTHHKPSLEIATRSRRQMAVLAATGIATSS